MQYQKEYKNEHKHKQIHVEQKTHKNKLKVREAFPTQCTC